MKVVLLQDVEKLGRTGDVKNVADGYGKNYLLPRGLAVVATPGAVKTVGVQKTAAAVRQARTAAEMAELAASLEGKQVEVTVKAGAKDRIYGSVTSADVARALNKLTGLNIEKKRIEMEKPVHELGTFKAMVKLSPEHSATISVVVKGE
ncbi:MAG: 50S ribosomal protein L9 [Chloroflexi bacterium]|nr:50S ribosomal protein L9 [Chloroflexota bacterium]